MNKIEFNITSPNIAYEYVKSFTGMSDHDLVNAYIQNSNSDSDIFWRCYHDKFVQVNDNDLYFTAYHVVGSIDECKEINQDGILNLQMVLSHDTIISKMLMKYGIIFDIPKKIMTCSGINYNIDYNSYRGIESENDTQRKLKSISHRIYYDFCVNGFFYCKDVTAYGTDIHTGAEFFYTLAEFMEEAKRLDDYWRKHSKSYKVYFKVPLCQIHRFTFDFEESFNQYTENELLELKRKMLSLALDVAFNNCAYEPTIYLKDDEYVRPDQIIDCKEINTGTI